MTFTQDDVEILDIKTVFQGYFRVDQWHVRHRTFAGGWTGTITREVFERGHAVAVLPYDPVHDRVVLIEQYRAGAQAAGKDPWLVEIVAGMIEEGEDPVDVCHRETAEECGGQVSDLIPVLDLLVTPGGSSESIKIYCGRVDSTIISGLHGLEDEGEDIRVFTLPLDEAVTWVKTGRINNSTAVAALLWLALEKDRVRAEWQV